MKKLLVEGSYSSYQLSDKSKDRLENWMKSVGIRHPIDKEDMHVTIVYSKENNLFPNYEPSQEPILLSSTTFRLNFDEFGGAIVIELSSPELTKKFKNSLKYGATSDYPTYRPHITVSYNGEANKHLKDKITPPDFDILLTHEEVEDLDDNDSVGEMLKKKAGVEEDAPANVSGNVATPTPSLTTKIFKRKELEEKVSISEELWNMNNEYINTVLSESYFINTNRPIVIVNERTGEWRFLKYGNL